MKLRAVVFPLLCLIALSCAHQEEMSLEQTFDQYTRAIQERNLDTLFQTVTENETVHFIGTTGQIMKTRQEYHEFHAEWFEESGWEIAFELKELYEEANLGYAMAVFTYSDATPDSRPLTVVSWVTLIFHREQGAWRMIADVCTPIRREIG